MPLNARPITMDDAADLFFIRGQCFEKNWNLKTFEETIAQPEFVGFIIPQTAYIIAQKIPPEAELITIAVAPAHRRQGIAEILLKNLWQNLRQQDIHTLHLEVNEKLTPARTLYEKLGFEPTGRRADYYGTGEDAILMRLQSTV